MSEETKREEAAAEDEKNRPLEDSEAEKVVGGSVGGPPTPPVETDDGWAPDGGVSDATILGGEGQDTSTAPPPSPPA